MVVQVQSRCRGAVESNAEVQKGGADAEVQRCRGADMVEVLRCCVYVQRCTYMELMRF